MKRKRNNDKRRELDLLQRWLSDLREESTRKPVVVEGKKDSIALGKFGIETEQIHKTNSSLDKRIEELSVNKECIILFDFDKSGRKIYSKIKNDLQSAGVKIDSRFRNFLLFKTKLRFIEGIDTYVKNLQK